MQIYKERFRFLLQIFLSGITAAWLFYHFIGGFRLWDDSDYTWSNFNKYISSPIPKYGIVLTFCVYLFVYFLLRILLYQSFSKKITGLFNSWFEKYANKQSYTNTITKILNFRGKLGRTLGEANKKPDLSLSDDVSIKFTSLLMLLHLIICCLLWHVIYSWLFIPIVIIIFVIMPLINGMINHFRYLNDSRHFPYKLRDENNAD